VVRLFRPARGTVGWSAYEKVFVDGVQIAGGGVTQLTSLNIDVRDLNPLRLNFGVPVVAVALPDGSTILNFLNYLVRFSGGVQGLSGVTVPSGDGNELYGFDSDGNHLTTVSARTGAPLRTFGYTGSVLTSITDGNGLVTNIARVGNTVTFTAPKGQVTTLTVDSEGFLNKFEKPTVNGVRDTWTFATGANKKMASQVDARGFTHSYTYDDNDLITADTDAAGKTFNFALISGTSASKKDVVKTTPEGRVFTYGVAESPTGPVLTYQPNGGALTKQMRGTNGIDITDELLATASSAPVFRTQVSTAPHPRLGALAPLQSRLITNLPGAVASRAFREVEAMTVTGFSQGSLTNYATETRTITTNPDNAAPPSIDGAMTGELVWTDVFDRAANSRTLTTPEGRSMAYTFDNKDRVVSASTPGIAPTTFGYNSEGRLSQVAQGSRSLTLGYDSLGTLASVTDHTGRVITSIRDALGRATQVTLPGGRTVLTSWDANDNANLLTPPGRPAHTQTYEPRNLLTAYTPPNAVNLASGAANYTYTWNGDRQIASLTRPEGTIPMEYVAIGQANEGTLKKVGDANTGELTITRDYANRVTGITNTTANGAHLAFSYFGALLGQVNWTGSITRSVAYEYNHHLKPSKITIDNAAFDIAYDKDGLSKSMAFAGATIALTRDTGNGRVTGSTLSQAGVTSITESRAFDATSGDLTGLSYARGAASVYAVTYARDNLGRVASKTETIGGLATTASYTYDAAGRLASETRGGVTTTWGFDLNGNRTTVNGVTVATVDAQDRLFPSSGGYGYTTAGSLASRPGATFAWNAFGNLTKATVGTTVVDYGYDARNRRVLRKVGGVAQSTYLYDGQLRIVGEITPTATRRFVYASGSNVPEAMNEQVGPTTTNYRLVTDQLGSVRLVVRLSDGVVVSRLDYDAWGNLLASSTGQSAQPFGFAGGLRDDVTGYTHFGARDYDPTLGRWISKDPSRWRGGENFYAYTNGDPVNWVDSTGNAPYKAMYRAAERAAEMGLKLGRKLSFKEALRERIAGRDIAAASKTAAKKMESAVSKELGGSGAVVCEQHSADGKKGAKHAHGLINETPYDVKGGKESQRVPGHSFFDVLLMNAIIPVFDSNNNGDLDGWDALDFFMPVPFEFAPPSMQWGAGGPVAMGD
jgi:RHS repeat-associated protein